VYKILVVGPNWVGDTVLAQPLFKRLQHKHRDAELHVLAPAWTRPLLRRMPEVREIIASPFGHGELKLGARMHLARALRQRNYDQAIVLPNAFKSALTPRLAGIGLRTGYVGELRRVLLNDARRLDRQALPQMAERFAHLADAPGQPLARPLPALALAASQAQQASTLARLQLALDRPAACLCPGAEYGPAKRWPAAHFAALAARLDAKGYQVWLIGSPKDRALGEEIAQAAAQRCRNLCGETDLEQAVDLLACAHLVVSNDSGLMHVAAALHRPLIALYGSSSPAFTPPLSASAQVMNLNLPCSPCFARECPLGHFDCMRRLTPEQVFARAADLLNQPLPA